jgi:CBS domain-containing protein
MLAKEIMRKRVITVTPETTLREVARIFLDNRISGAPVVDGFGRLVGVVSQTDLVRRDREASLEDVPAYHQDPEEARLPSGLHIEDPDYACVKDVMTPKAITFEEDRPIYLIARTMLRERIHRVVITRQGRLCGILTSMDLLKALMDAIEKNAAPAV